MKSLFFTLARESYLKFPKMQQTLWENHVIFLTKCPYVNSVSRRRNEPCRDVHMCHNQKLSRTGVRVHGDYTSPGAKSRRAADSPSPLTPGN